MARMSFGRPWAVGLVGVALLAGCPRKEPQAENTEPLTAGEARLALEETAAADQAMKVTGGAIEIATDFTIGGAVEVAAMELAAFYESQLPCAAIAIDGATLAVEYGADGACLHRGQAYSGTHTITVTRNDESDVVVEHTWDRLSNGVVQVTGTAEVTWSLDDPSRRVVHDLDWRVLATGREGTGTGDRLQRPLAGGIAVGFSVDGERTWSGEGGAWHLDIEEVEMRWVDPIPQAGRYVLETPANKSVELSFERLDEDTIRATLTSGERSFDFDVTSTGGIDEST